MILLCSEKTSEGAHGFHTRLKQLFAACEQLLCAPNPRRIKGEFERANNISGASETSGRERIGSTHARAHTYYKAAVTLVHTLVALALSARGDLLLGSLWRWQKQQQPALRDFLPLLHVSRTRIFGFCQLKYLHSFFTPLKVFSQFVSS